MNQVEEYKDGLQYPEEVRNAVRYGYRYRKEAEERPDIHSCLVDSSDFLLWVANLVIGGISWDILKSSAEKLYKQLIKKNAKIDKHANDLFSDESKLKEFYIYIKEFHEHRMSVTEKQFLYIKEEIIADYMGNVAGEIYEQEKRMPTIEEIKEMSREAFNYAEKVLK